NPRPGSANVRADSAAAGALARVMDKSSANGRPGATTARDRAASVQDRRRHFARRGFGREGGGMMDQHAPAAIREQIDIRGKNRICRARIAGNSYSLINTVYREHAARENAAIIQPEA